MAPHANVRVLHPKASTGCHIASSKEPRSLLIPRFFYRIGELNIQGCVCASFELFFSCSLRCSFLQC